MRPLPLSPTQESFPFCPSVEVGQAPHETTATVAHTGVLPLLSPGTDLLLPQHSASLRVDLLALAGVRDVDGGGAPPRHLRDGLGRPARRGPPHVDVVVVVVVDGQTDGMDEIVLGDVLR